jgi:Family of unknown function (DUF5330)
MVNKSFPEFAAVEMHLIQFAPRSFTASQLDFDRSKGTKTDTRKVGHMGMLRTLFVLGAGFAFMPSPPIDTSSGQAPAGPSSFTYLAAAAETVADMRSFCQRNPNVCVTAGAVAQTVEGKAKYSAKLIYEWANEATGDGMPANLPENLAKADPIQTASPPASVAMQESDNTLTVADLEPKWRKPKIRPKG